jgi:hypothetical protein
MKRLIVLFVLLAGATLTAFAQYPFYSIRQIQEVPAESLAVADTIPNFSNNSTQLRWTLQRSPLYGDTVTTVGIVAIPPGVVTYTLGTWTMLLYDTAAANTQWKGILLRANSLADTTQLKLNGFLNVSPGDIITITGVIQEFPTSRGVSATQFAPLASQPITIIGSAPLPPPVVKNIADFNAGLFPGNDVQYATGEPFEGMYVEFHNVTVNNKVNTTRGTFSFVDQLGNELSDYDWSHFFTLGHGSSSLPPYPADTGWAQRYQVMGNGMRIDTIRGYITTSSGSESPRGYRLCPIYPSDIVFSTVPAPPVLSSHRRNPVVVTPDSTARISVRVTEQAGGSTPDSVLLKYSVGNAAYVSLPMTFQASDTTYAGVIPAQLANTRVRYFVQVADTFGQVIRLANSATSGLSSDTSKGVFFYYSLDRPLTIQDVQTTPYVNGRTPYLGAVLSLSGIITADTAHVGISPFTNGSTNAWYMQSSNAPWSGIWLTTTDTAAQRQLSALVNGDSATVTGTVQEQFDVTRLGSITSVVKATGGNPEPAAVVRTSGSLNVGNGTAGAEAYEGMLVKLNNLTVTDVNPTFSDVTEFSVNDGSGATVVQRSGKYSYSNIPGDSSAGKIILRVGNRIGSLTGIVYYSFNQYKFVPRTDADFVGVILTGVGEGARPVPQTYELSQNYPNPFNPSTVIEYAVPAAGPVTLKVYNILGQELRTLVNAVQDAGHYRVRFDGTSLGTGVYFYRLQAGSFSRVEKMLLLK